MAGGVTVIPGLNVLGKTDPFRVHRLGAATGESRDHFRIKISPAGRIYPCVKRFVANHRAPREHRVS
jgi:hypothetical protein